VLSLPVGRRTVEQRLVLLTPEYYRIDGKTVDWVSYHRTRELSPDTVRDLIYKHAARSREPLKDLDKRLLVYRFFLQARWTDEAEQELERILRAYPAQRERLQSMRENLSKLLTAQYVERLELAHKVGQHQEAQDRIARFFDLKMASLVSEKAQLRVQELKTHYQTAAGKLKDARRFLETLLTGVPPARRDFFRKATGVIAEELHLDTLGRLETFVTLARDWERAFQQKRPPGQTPEELLGFAVSGWLLGDSAAEKNPDNARRLWEAREAILACHKEPNDPAARKQRAASLAKENLGADVLARMIPLLPPPEPYEKLGARLLEVNGNGQGAGYQVHLPPEYHHLRQHPVLIVLHHSAEKPEQAIGRWADLAARQGFLVVAPAWGKEMKPKYEYTPREHLAVLDTLRDLRRRFQIDSDRVFLFGAEEGGKMAWDVGLSHPDLFAGVMPMAATPRFHNFRYWPNAQYLPFYVVNGDHTGPVVKDTRILFRDWIRWNYPAMNVEYRGRPNEFFEAEVETLMDWMSRKKRARPQKELGFPEEFKTMRETDNRFYWLSANALDPRVLNHAGKAWNQRTVPAKLQARIFTDNQINVRTFGVRELTLWLGPGAVNYAQKVRVNINGAVLVRLVTPSVETLLEDFCQQGDRQRLFWARIDLKVAGN
jgi:hypothetical protein